MSDRKHTPGPWGYFQDDDYGEEFVVDVPAERRQWPGNSQPWMYQKVAEVRSGEPETTRANAALIAAAPDLLETLEAIAEDLDWALLVESDYDAERVKRHQQMLAAAEAAIAKAKGEEADE